MTGRNDRPGAGSGSGSGAVDRPGQGGSARRPQDELRRRLANLPANHPSSPWYRERTAGRERPGKGQDAPGDGETAGTGEGAGAETRAGGATGSTLNRYGGSRSFGRGRPAEAGREPVPETAGGDAAERGRPGEAAAAAVRAVRGVPAEPDQQSRRRADDALWQRAASQQAASEARRQARGGTPIAPRPARDPYRPWFADGTGEDPWLSAEEGGEPWFTGDDR
jgi:hypothetical protein